MSDHMYAPDAARKLNEAACEYGMKQNLDRAFNPAVRARYP